jgi:membrane AbrB-like protein
MKAARDSWQNPALSLALCAVAGALFAWLRLPLPWMLGPLTAMAACNFAGAGLRAFPGARECGQVIIGTALGMYFTPLVGREVISYWGLLLIAGVGAIVLGILGGAILSALAGVDRGTAFFASVPGGANEMTLLGERYGARPDRIALAWGAGLPIATMVLATAPGGLAEMCITAKVLQLGVPLVTAAHVTRVFLLLLSTGPVYRAALALGGPVRR